MLRRCQWLPRAFDFWPLSRAQRILHEGVAEYSRMAVCVWVCGCGCVCVCEREREREREKVRGVASCHAVPLPFRA